MYFDHIYTLFPASYLCLAPQHIHLSTACLLLKKINNPLSSITDTPMYMGVRPSTGSWKSVRGPTPEWKIITPDQQISPANSSLARGGRAFWAPSSPVLEIGPHKLCVSLLWKSQGLWVHVHNGHLMSHRQCFTALFKMWSF